MLRRLQRSVIDHEKLAEDIENHILLNGTTHIDQLCRKFGCSRRDIGSAIGPTVSLVVYCHWVALAERVETRWGSVYRKEVRLLERWAVPTPEEIKKATEEIQAGWSPEEKVLRRQCYGTVLMQRFFGYRYGYDGYER